VRARRTGRALACLVGVLVYGAGTLANPADPTPAIRGPLTIDGSKILDRGEPVLLRGVQLLALDPDADQGPPAGIAGLTPTTFSTIRLRWDMNAVRLLVSVQRSIDDPNYIERIAEIAAQANDADLLVILAAVDDARDSAPTNLPTRRVADFWKAWARRFRDSPRILFDLLHNPLPDQIPGPRRLSEHTRGQWRFWRDGGMASNGVEVVGMQALVDVVRAAGVTRPVIAMGLNRPPFFRGFDRTSRLLDDQVIYEVCPLYRSAFTDRDRDRQFGFLARDVPFLANNWDLRLAEDSADCRSLPSYPESAARRVRDNLDYFDRESVSWTVSLFQPGFLIEDYLSFDPTTLLSGWTCGEAQSPSPGMGEEIRFHMWASRRHEITLVNGAGGGRVLARGGAAIAYNPDLADAEVFAPPNETAETLGGVSLELVDHRGQARRAPLFYVSPTQINLWAPDDLAPGPIRVRLIRPGGAEPIGRSLLADVAPGLFTATANARGAVIGLAQSPGLPPHPLARCDSSGCITLAAAPDGVFPVEAWLYGTGFRNAPADAAVDLRIGDVRIEGAKITAAANGVDVLAFEIDDRFRGLAETDVSLRFDGRLANTVRLRIE